MTTWTWATVTKTQPLRITLDGLAEKELPFTPVRIGDTAGLVVGQRVWCQMEGVAIIIHAVSPAPPSQPGPPVLAVMNGPWMEEHLVDNQYRWTMPYTLPSIAVTTAEGQGFTSAGTAIPVATPSGATITALNAYASGGDRYWLATNLSNWQIRIKTFVSGTIALPVTFVLFGTKP